MNLRVLFLTLEFTDPIFSGNGTYGRSLVRSLLHRGVDVLVVCAAPSSLDENTLIQNTIKCVEPDHPNIFTSSCLQIIIVPVRIWNRLDRYSDWNTFASGIKDCLPTIQSFNADLIVCVDWSSLKALESLIEQDYMQNLPIVYLCFRVFHFNSGLSKDDEQFYTEMERYMVSLSSRTLALCDADANQLRSLVPCANISHLHPPLRKEILKLVRLPRVQKFRRYITCCCRLSPEKNTMLFVDMIAACIGDLRELGLIPFLCGSSSDEQYGQQIKTKLKLIAPESIVKDILSTKDLFDVFSETRLNVHPAVYEAYGMTVMEAAAAGAPSIVHTSGIGVVDRLCGEPSAVLTANMNDLASAAIRVQQILSSQISPSLNEIGNTAQQRALEWCEKESGDALLQHLRNEINELT